MQIPPFALKRLEDTRSNRADRGSLLAFDPAVEPSGICRSKAMQVVMIRTTSYEDQQVGCLADTVSLGGVGCAMAQRDSTKAREQQHEPHWPCAAGHMPSAQRGLCASRFAHPHTHARRASPRSRSVF
mmetsp:Transcript_39235/g.104180  ORF Transcript_39235/g.104180 Transcript_39235/m.104180 type:complete len:128 (-) Transcript_39235:2-385(-)